MKLILYCIIFSIATTVCLGQTQDQTKTVSKCELTATQAPALRGIRLQMSADELLALFPGSSDDSNIKGRLDYAVKAPFYGVADISFQPDKYTTKAQFEGINDINVRLFDNRVTQIYVSYGNGDAPPWNHVDEMIMRVSEAFRLPSVENWLPVSSTDSKTLQCSGFTVQVYAIRQENACCSSLNLKMQGIEEKVTERKKATIEKAKRDFKP